MFTVEQTYDLASVTALCRAARKTVRKIGRIVHGVLWGIFILLAALSLWLVILGGTPGFWTVVVMALMLALLLLRDRLDGWLVLRGMLPGTAHSVTAFEDGEYVVTTDSTVTSYQYANITQLCETERYFFFFLGDKHGQIFDKKGFRTGSTEAFRTFIEQKTGLSFKKV